MKICTAFFLLIIVNISIFGQREMEALNRGLIGLNNNGSVYLSWRLFALEDYSVGFNVYRSVNGGDFTKINATEIVNTTDFIDNSANVNNTNSYYVIPVINGVEQARSETFTIQANTPSRQYFPIALEPIPGVNFDEYNVLHVYPGDIDGDGDYDYIVKRFPVDASYHTILLDCYNNEGTFLWRIDLGPNVETYISSMTAPVLVADFNSDGKAEIIAKTGESTVFGDGFTIGDTNNDGTTDYNSHEGAGNQANIFEGPEFISLINGETGTEIDRNNFIARGNTCDWGDCYGARVNFIMSTTGYFDGVHPAALFSRGEGSRMVVESWKVENNRLVPLWQYTAVGKTYSVGGWTDFHQIQCIDVDGDGKDEASWGACMLNDDGSLLYTTKYVHGDRFQITDIDPRRPGLEVFIVQQNNPNLIGSALYDAATGSTIKDWYLNATADVGRGDAADVDPNSPGLEMYDTGNGNLHASNGTEAASSRPYPWVSIWWDGDLLRENLIGVGSGGYNPAINKWNYNTNSEERINSLYNDGGSYVVTCPYGGRMALVGDVIGDWREEIFLETTDRTTLRIYTSNIPSEARLYTLMQNPAYRVAITSKGYLCTKYTDYFLGANMEVPTPPNIVTLGESSVGNLFSTASDGSVEVSWQLRNFNLNSVQLMRNTSNDTASWTTVYTSLEANYSYSDADVVNGTTYYYWLKIVEQDGSITVLGSSEATPEHKNVIVRARGETGEELIEVLLNETVMETFQLSTDYADYALAMSLDGNIRVNFINDASGRDAYVDYIIVNGSILQAEDMETNTATYANGVCGAFGFSENLQCNGYIEFVFGVDCNNVVNGSASIDDCGLCSGGNTGIGICGIFTANINEGWNLVCLTVHPADSSVQTIFPNAIAVKSMDEFWESDRPFYLNSLNEIVAGKGYLVYSETDTTYTIQAPSIGMLHETSIAQGWHIVGITQTQTIIDYFGNELESIQEIKDFESFWKPDGSGTLESMEAGKAYFVKK